MSKADTWMPLYIGDYLADTMHLEAREHGAYLLLIMHYWRNGPLPDDDRILAGIARVDRKTWTSDTAEIVRPFFISKGKFLHHKRIDAERDGAKQNADKKRSAAEARWGKSRVQKTSTPDAGANAHAYANGDADASDVDMQGTCPYAGASPSPSPSPSPTPESSASKPREPERDASTRIVKPPNPCPNDPVEAWHHLADEIEKPSSKHNANRPIINVSGHPQTYLDLLALDICRAAGISRDFRGPWDYPIAWLRAGIHQDQIVATIAQVAKRDGYNPPSTLKYFDKPVRGIR